MLTYKIIIYKKTPDENEDKTLKIQLTSQNSSSRVNNVKNLRLDS